MNEFKLTKNANKIVEFYENISTPASVQECIEGVFSVSCDKTPNLTKGINKIFNLIKSIKQEIKEDYEYYENTFQKPCVYSIFDKDLTFFLDNCTVFLVTTDDIDNKEEVWVKDLFTQDEQLIPIPFPEGKIDKENTKWVPTYLGVYTPSTGSIFLFVDLIYMHHENPELLFQKVLLHEFIHAFLDVVPRIIKDGEVKNLIPDNNIEEPYDNTLVLYTYHGSRVNQNIFDYVENFISNQAYPYNHAIDYYNRGTELNVFKIILKEFLKGKFLATPSKSKNFLSIDYGNDEVDNTGREIIPEIQSLLPKDLSLLNEEDLEKLKNTLNYHFSDFLSDHDINAIYETVQFSPTFPFPLSLKYKLFNDTPHVSMMITILKGENDKDIYLKFDVIGDWLEKKIIYSYKAESVPSFKISSNVNEEESPEIINFLISFNDCICQLIRVLESYDDIAYQNNIEEQVRTTLINLFPQLKDHI